MSFANMLWRLASMSDPSQLVQKFYHYGTGSKLATGLGYPIVSGQLGQQFSPVTFSPAQGWKDQSGIPYLITNPDTWVSMHGVGQLLIGLKADGSVWDCGWDQGAYLSWPTELGSWGVPGQAALKPVSFPSGRPNTGFIQVSAGTEHFAALHGDGTVWVWGDNSYSSQLAVTNYFSASPSYRSVSSRRPLNMHDTDEVADQTLQAPRTTVLNAQNQPVDGPPVFNPHRGFLLSTKFKKVSAGHRWTMALDQDGKIWSWGNNGSRQCGRATRYSTVSDTGFTADPYIRRTPDTDPDHKTFSSDPLNLSIGRIDDVFVYISAGAYHGGAINNLGELYLWGNRQNGQTGRTSADTSLLPWKVPSPRPGVKFAKLACGEYSTATILEDGSAWVCGRNSYGQCGIGITVNADGTKDVYGLTQLPGTWRDIYIGIAQAAGIKADGTLWVWGNDMSGAIGLGGGKAPGRDDYLYPTPVQVGTATDWHLAVPVEDALVVLKKSLMA